MPGFPYADHPPEDDWPDTPQDVSQDGRPASTRLREAVTALEAMPALASKRTYSREFQRGAKAALRAIEEAYGGSVAGLPDRIDAVLTAWARELGLPVSQDEADARRLRIVWRQGQARD